MPSTTTGSRTGRRIRTVPAAGCWPATPSRGRSIGAFGRPASRPPYTGDDRQPASVVLWTGRQLAPCDPGGEVADLSGDPPADGLTPNNRLVVYEMPTAWSRVATPGELGIGVGTFQNVAALIDPASPGANFDDLQVTAPGRSYLTDLGVNALELPPPADSSCRREWGYGTAHYLAPNTDLGFPGGYTSSTGNRDLAALVTAARRAGIRVLTGSVMAFGAHEANQSIAFDDLCIDRPGADPSDPDALESRPNDGFRDGLGSVLWRYARPRRGYDPVSGAALDPLYRHDSSCWPTPSRWMDDFRTDGVRIDSVENVADWDFGEAFKDHVRERFGALRGIAGAEADARVLLVGEELWVPKALIAQGRLDGLWNYAFSGLVRRAVMGWGDNFETLVRQMVDCRALGFRDGAQAANYIASHDVESYWNLRPYDFLLRSGIPEDQVPRRIKLAFACLLTAVGIPMILAGDEFGDRHDRLDPAGDVDQAGGKQVDPVDYGRAAEASRADLLAYVARLTRLRTSHPALGMNHTRFIHVDLTPGRRVLAWSRGDPADPVLVVANFSDWGTDDPFGPGAEYHVPGWPAGDWHEVTRDRPAPQAGREPLFPWEAKVYRHMRS